jgi:hypothetical protein
MESAFPLPFNPREQRHLFANNMSVRQSTPLRALGLLAYKPTRKRKLRCQKGINEGAVTCKNCYLGCFGLAFSANVKKVPNAPAQGLDPGEMTFRDFPFRLKKSRK